MVVGLKNSRIIMSVEQKCFVKKWLRCFKKIPVTFPKHVYYIDKGQMLLINIGGKWFMDKHIPPPSPIKMEILIKELHKKEDNIEIFKDIINIGIIENYKSIGISLSGLFPEVVMWRKPISYIFPQVIYKR